jgi:hypothetical protein
VRKNEVNAVLCNKLPSPEICAEEKAVVSRWDVGVVSRLALSWFLPMLEPHRRVEEIILVFPVTCTPRLRAHRQNLDFYPTNTTLSLNIFTMEKDIEEALADLET